jgi:hypothetical protein
MTVREIQGHLVELYAADVSPDLISRVTDAILDEVREWQKRPLDSVYPVVFFDALRVKIRDEGLVKNEAVYVALALNPDGEKDVLGLWIELRGLVVPPSDRQRHQGPMQDVLAGIDLGFGTRSDPETVTRHDCSLRAALQTLGSGTVPTATRCCERRFVCRCGTSQNFAGTTVSLRAAERTSSSLSRLTFPLTTRTFPSLSRILDSLNMFGTRLCSV